MPLNRPVPTKLSPPTSSQGEVLRAEVLQQISEVERLQVVVLSAPAGFGKTTAMSQLHAQLAAAGRKTAWVTLDRGDNDTTRFLACLSSALDVMTGSSPSGATDYSPTRPLTAVRMAADIMHRVAALSDPCCLFLDDFECLTEQSVIQLVRELIHHLPRSALLVMASRSLPEIGLGRLRAMGLLAEIGPAQLRFSAEEAATFLNDRRKLQLSRQQVQVLQSRTEGWIAGMWLASSALAHRPDRAGFIQEFTGSNQLVAQYLTEDVFERLDPSIQEFLLCTCVPDEIDLPLCELLCQRSDGRQILAHLQATNLFISAMGGPSPVYRYHSLFLQFLRDKLGRDRPQELTRLHELAARCFESRGQVVSAIDHWIEAREYDQACRVLAEHAEGFLESGRMRLLARWFELLPRTSWARSDHLSLVRIWALCFTRGPWKAMEQLDGLLIGPDADCAPVRAHLLALRPTLLVMMDQVEQAYEAGLKAVREMPDSPGFAAGVLANEMAYIFRLMGDQRQSMRMLSMARDLSSSGHFHTMYSESIEGIIDLEEGRMREAASRFQIATTSDGNWGQEGAGSAWAGILHAGAHYQRNDLASAERLLQTYLPLARELGLVDHLIAGYRMLARIAAAQGHLDQAFHRLAELEQVGQQRRVARIVCGAKLERARLLLMQGNFEGARDELDRANRRDVWDRERRLRLPAHDVEYWELADLRWQIFSGRTQGIPAKLERLARQASSEKRHRRALKMNVLWCIAACRLRSSLPEMLPLMEVVLRTAHSEGLVRTLLDEGDHVAMPVGLVRQTLRARSGPSDRAFLEFLDSLCEHLGGPAVDSAEWLSPSGLDQLLEPLTPKEIKILSLLSQGYSNNVLAEKLFVSTSTVRTHLRHINSKLNVGNRTEAVAVARRLGLLKS
ncbi:MAG: LuxR C-terminal-related transcriptional regulator [Comamonadaceae bacterium]|nr:LuxR C-terminal-related transcriptional regulator [Comamonadaceae bacterium]